MTDAARSDLASLVPELTVSDFAQSFAFYTDILGDAKLREFSQGILDPEGQKPFEYKDGMFLRSRPGMTPSLQPNGVASPLPVLP